MPWCFGLGKGLFEMIVSNNELCFKGSIHAISAKHSQYSWTTILIYRIYQSA